MQLASTLHSYYGWKVLYWVLKSWPLVHVLRQVTLIHVIPSFLSNCFLTLPSHLRLGLPSDLNIRFSSNNLLIISFFSHACCMAAPVLTKIVLKKKRPYYASFSSYLFYLPPWFKISSSHSVLINSHCMYR